MAISLTGVWDIFSHMKEYLCHIEGERVALNRGIHKVLADFPCLEEDLSKLHKRLYEIVPLQTMLDGYHDASGYMCGGAVLTGPREVSLTPQAQPSAASTPLESVVAHPIVCRAHFTADITANIVSWGNPEVQVTSSDLELVGSVIHHACMADCL